MYFDYTIPIIASFIDYVEPAITHSLVKKPTQHHHEEREEEINNKETSSSHNHPQNVVNNVHKQQQLVHSAPINSQPQQQPQQHFHHMYNNNNVNNAQNQQPVTTPVVEQQSIAVHLGSVEIQPDHALLAQQQQPIFNQAQPVAVTYQQPIATTLMQQPEQYVSTAPQSMYPQPSIVSSPYTQLTDPNAAAASHYSAAIPPFDQTQAYLQTDGSHQLAAFSSQGNSDSTISTNSYYGEILPSTQHSNHQQQQQQQQQKQQETSDKKMKGMYLLPTSTYSSNGLPSSHSPSSFYYGERNEESVGDYTMISPGARL